MNFLLIVASGKSSRFGGFPKSFCDLGGKTSLAHTIEKSGEIFDKIYVGVNNQTYEKFHDSTAGCEIFAISTGQGDAHSLLKCLDIIKAKESGLKKIMVCWGDAIFVDSSPFLWLIKYADTAQVAVACAVDAHPYAWFETDENDRIIKSHFAREEGNIEYGLHDQSLFLLDFEFARQYLDEYRLALQIPYNNDESTADINEMRLLYSFEYLKKAGYESAKCVRIPAGKVLSFNTHEELENIKISIGR